MTTPVTCALYVDGVWLADGGPRPDPDAPPPPDADPTALSGLSITWGRSTTVDQPQSSSCSFDVMDLPGGSSFLDVLATGSRVDVYATGRTWPDPTDNRIPDPSFSAAPLESDPGWLISGGGVATVSALNPRTGRASVAILASGPSVLAVIPPGPWAAATAPPGSWDHLPRAQGGQRFTAAAHQYRRGPSGPVQVGVGLVWIDSPAWRYRLPAITWSPGAPDAWTAATVSATVPPAAVGQFVGLAVGVADALGLSWDDPAAARPWDDWPGSWDDLRTTWIDDVAVLAPDGQATDSTVLVFSGRITDLDAGWDQALAAPVISVIAQDFLAELGQRDIGDEPWPAESLAVRAARIIALSQMAISPVLIDADAASVRVSYMDVDRQQAAPLLADLATSADAVLWAATHIDSGPYLWIQSTARAAMLTLSRGPDGVVRIVPTAGVSGLTVSACDVLLDPVTWRHAVADVTTRVALRWLDQTPDEDGTFPTERTVQVTDADLEADVGTYRLGVGTVLADLADAERVADRYLARLRRDDWRLSGLTWRTDADGGVMSTAQVRTVLALLDGTRRLAAGILLVDLPRWNPSGQGHAAVYLEGGTYDYVGGQWTLALTVSSASGRGSSITWQEMPAAYTWDDMDPAIAWSDLIGVGVRPPQLQEVVA